MENESFQTVTEYEAALREIERLFDAVPGTPQAEQLETLSRFVEAYEDEHFPMPQPSLMAQYLYKLEKRRFLPKWKINR
jgi:HTH-type transcriptional regulator/antitoxin HigA